MAYYHSAKTFKASAQGPWQTIEWLKRGLLRKSSQWELLVIYLGPVNRLKLLINLHISLFQALGGWGRGKKRAGDWAREKQEGGLRRGTVEVKLASFVSFACCFFFARPQQPRAWNRLASHWLENLPGMSVFSCFRRGTPPVHHLPVQHPIVAESRGIWLLWKDNAARFVKVKGCLNTDLALLAVIILIFWLT